MPRKIHRPPTAYDIGNLKTNTARTPVDWSEWKTNLWNRDTNAHIAVNNANSDELQDKVDLLNWKWKEPLLKRFQIVMGLSDLNAWYKKT
jgi:hypothetical protein